MTEAARFCLKNREMSAEPLHYTMCGLDDIYLLNGFKIHETAHGRGVAVENTDNLYKVIGIHLITCRKVLGPKDVKFLRKNMKFTQEELAVHLGVTSQTVARYEKGLTDIPGPVDRLLRVCYAYNLLPPEQKAAMIEELMVTMKNMEGMDETGDDPVYFGSTGIDWNQATKVRSPLYEMA